MRARGWLLGSLLASSCAGDLQTPSLDAGGSSDRDVGARDVSFDAPRDAGVAPGADVPRLDVPPRDAGVDASRDVAGEAAADAGVALRCARGVDTDRDGLNNDDECALNTDPFMPDSDGDGLADGVEARYPRACVATAPASQRRPAAVCTRDAECRTGERCLGLDPRRNDSDGDGVYDGVEDPSGDGRFEVARGESDPRLYDTDGDGVHDGESGLGVCRPGGLASVTQVAQAGSRVQVGYDPAFSRALRLMGTAGRGALRVDDPLTGVAALAVAMPSMGDVRAEATRIEAEVQAALGASTTAVLVGRALTTHEQNPGVTSTFRVARMSSASALRDALVTPLSGAVAPPPAMPTGAAMSFLVDVTTVRRTQGAAAGTTEVAVTVAPQAMLEDRAQQTAFRASDFANVSGFAESDRGVGFHCQLLRAPAPRPVDFVWTVDVSISMNPVQQSVGATAERFFSDLRRAGVDFRVAVLRAQSAPFDFARPGLVWVDGASPTGARDLAWRTTVSPYAMQGADTLQPYPHAGDFAVQLYEEPLAAGVLATESLLDGAAMNLPLARRVRPGALLVNFFVADETGNNDDMRFFAQDTARWGVTYAMRLARAVAFFRSRQVLTFGMVNDQRTACAANDARDMRKCLITGNGGAYIPIATATPADVQAAMDRIVATVIGATSPYQLERTPITSTIKVRVRGRDVPRSRLDGFDYDPSANSVIFYGATYRPAAGDEVALSYRIWQPCPSLGASCSNDGECCAPRQCRLGRCELPCAPLGERCVADADCCAPNRCVGQRCAAPTTCRATGERCALDADCCAPNRCTAGFCQPPPLCRPVGAMCATPADCCSNTCTQGRCERPPCRPTGGPCATPEDCCSTYCANGGCAPG